MRGQRSISSPGPTFRTPLSHWGYQWDRGVLRYGGTAIEDLAKAHETPFYLFMGDRLRHNVRNAAATARAILPHSELCYSVKTNGHQAVLKTIREENLGAEVISYEELNAARAFEFPKGRVVFNGPGKTDDELRQALRAGAHINVESCSEAKALCRIADEDRVNASVGIRINTDVFDAPPRGDMRMVGAANVFGMDPQSPEFREAVNDMTQSEWVHFHALSAHAGTGIATTTPYRQLAKNMGELRRDLASTGTRIDTLDMGGGFSVSSEVRYHGSLFDSFEPHEPAHIPGPGDIATFEGCCRAIADELKAWPPVTIILEPGRLLVSDVFHLVTRVIRLKVQHGVVYAILDASRVQNALFVGRGYHDILHVRDPLGEPHRPYTLVGPLCASFDVFARHRPLPDLREGDLVMVCDVGAYNLSAQSDWSFRRAPVVSVGE